jgi:hypothetical protein
VHGKGIRQSKYSALIASRVTTIPTNAIVKRLKDQFFGAAEIFWIWSERCSAGTTIELHTS